MRTLIAAVLLLAFVATGGSGQPEKEAPKKTPIPLDRLEAELTKYRDRLKQLDVSLENQREEILTKYRKAMEEAKRAYQRALMDAQANGGQERKQLALRIEKLENMLRTARGSGAPAIGPSGLVRGTPVGKPSAVEEKLNLILKRLEEMDKRLQKLERHPRLRDDEEKK